MPIKYFVAMYIALKILLIVFLIKPYNYNLWSLVGIWDGFFKLNPKYFCKGIIVFQNGGYDGQFFYLITKYLVTENISLPILDSFYLRFHRIGLSLVLFPFIKIFGVSIYPFVLSTLLTLFHLLSFYSLKALCETDKKYFSLFYLFSPFSLNSDLLLVADSLMVSFLIIGLYFFIRSQILSNQNFIKKKYLYLSIFLFGISLFVKEGALFLIAPFILYSILQKKWSAVLVFFLVILSYISFTQYTKTISGTHPGTNPLNFLELSDLPFFGLLKSFDTPNDSKGIIRELIKIPLLFYFIFLISLVGKKWSLNSLIFYSPIFFTLLQIAIAEEGYWRAFDNISRMYALSLPYSIFLYSEKNTFRFKAVMTTGLCILLLLILRIVLIKKEMPFNVFL
ncbi:MAG: hypothetical protein HS129_15605 [Leptospiraceae bacterium]|nr:hypothetical protein [Leptospiraceae bacterium]